MHGIIIYIIHCPDVLLLNKENWLSQILQIITAVFVAHKVQSFKDLELRGNLAF